MKTTCTLFLLCSFFTIDAQQFSDPKLQSLVDAERAFARRAKETNTRDAFLYFLADDAVTSIPGEGPRIGKKYLIEQKPNESLLLWEPVYSDIAASGDFGFNTGPWQFKQKRTDEPVAFGDFVSVWRKNAQGDWKVAVDIGISHGPTPLKDSVTTSSIILKRGGLKSKDTKSEVLEVERKFIAAFAREGNEAYENVKSQEARFYRAGNLPYLKRSEIDELLHKAAKITYNFMDAGAASSGDLAYAYGNATIEFVKDGITENKKCSYLRFWKKENNKDWKIVLDLLSN